MIHRTPLLALLAFLAVPGVIVAQSQPTQAPTAAPAPTAAATQENRDPLLDLPPLPKHRVTLIGGTIAKLDPVRDRLVVQAFGGKKMRINFDVRTRFYYNGNPVAQRELKPGQRVYLDTMLNGDKVFAKTVWIETAPVIGDGRGQVLNFDPGEQVLTVRDELSSQSLKFQLTPATVIHNGEATSSAADLRPGSLVSLSFGPPQGRYATVREISLLATPGSVFSFFGRITFLDLSRHIVAVNNRNDEKTYEISVLGVPDSILRSLHEGTEVGVSAVFDGSHYMARTIAPAADQGDSDQ